ncbi:pyridoxamine 5'-phosphate oxidase family protein [Halobaculum magnesiiphilum]|uniref:Pyridoxamine 5'-phosphate oxidase family protein n=1 Tax=Halobaculum magnesiiphilum TaxID=1017351 RepID=A0A8T8WEV5_9EURY|nr:pyridoxamine 5'-phosphate oxidase family protein [Halobaculum magnesiiphilum]QZP38361.1 pyridoxamine 5'-phosphate oxidase family protein [Halobaculum magnesiiphilum]
MDSLSALRDHLDGLALSAHLATAVDDRPHVAPVWFVLDDDADAVWLFTGGRKLENIDRNPRVALSIESADRAGTVDWQATLLGTAARVDDPERAAWVERRLAETYAMHADTEADESGAEGGDNEGDGEVSSQGLLRVDVASATLTAF